MWLICRHRKKILNLSLVKSIELSPQGDCVQVELGGRSVTLWGPHPDAPLLFAALEEALLRGDAVFDLFLWREQLRWSPVIFVSDPEV